MPDSKRASLSEDQILLILKAMADRRRYEILKQLRECEGPLACETVRQCTDISPATLSHHMKELETAGLVRVVRQQKYANYFLRRDVLETFLNQLKTDLICSL